MKSSLRVKAHKCVPPDRRVEVPTGAKEREGKTVIWRKDNEEENIGKECDR